MSEKWTKGPWHVEVGTEYDDHGTVYVCHPETSCPETVICKFEDYNDEQDRGNAHLIAAAPDMYEMLKHIKDKMLYPLSRHEGDIGMFAEGFGIATNELLKKARGES